MNKVKLREQKIPGINMTRKASLPKGEFLKEKKKKQIKKKESRVHLVNVPALPGKQLNSGGHLFYTIAVLKCYLRNKNCSEGMTIGSFFFFLKQKDKV